LLLIEMLACAVEEVASEPFVQRQSLLEFSPQSAGIFGVVLHVIGSIAKNAATAVFELRRRAFQRGETMR
jgi:hypothetical protein